MAHYAAVASVVHLLHDIIHHHLYREFLLPRKGIVESLYGKFSLLLESLQDYSSRSGDEGAPRIRDMAFRAQDILVSEIPNQIHRRGRGDLTVSIEFGEELVQMGEKVDSVVDELLAVKEKSSPLWKSLPDEDFPWWSSYYSSYSDTAFELFPHRSVPLVGFDEQVRQILEQVNAYPHELRVIPIVGTAGIGKTTLATEVFHHAYIRSHFECYAWVTISQNYNANKVLQDLLNSLGVHHDDDDDDSDDDNNDDSDDSDDVDGETVRLRVSLFKKLRNRPYLIVVDDLWSKEAWADLKQIFPDHDWGSRIVLTTRFKDVAHYAARDGFIHEIPFLNEDQSWSLLQRKVFLQKRCPPKLEDVGRLVASKCGGLPLAILVIAGILTNNAKALQCWEDIARYLNSSLKEEDDEIMFQALSLSYGQLPDQLKALFLYLGSFQDDHEFSVSTLAKLLVAEGFVKSVGECLEVLVKRNLVLITKKNVDHHGFKFCTLHDAVRNFIRRRACDEHFFHVVQDQKGRLYTGEIDSIELERGKLLRVLDVVETTPWSVLNAVVVHMFHLRYLTLHLEGLRLGSDLPPLPPSISMLQNLQTLIIYHPGAESLILPPEIWKMTQLKHVIVTIMTLPPPISTVNVQKLEYLQTLSIVLDFVFTDEAIEMIPNLRKLIICCTGIDVNSLWEFYCLDNLVRLYHLEELQIILGGGPDSGLDFIWTSFVFPLNLRKLNIHMESHMFQHLEDLDHLLRLEALKIMVYNVPHFVHNSLLGFALPLNLRKLTLGGCRLPWEEMTVVGSLPNLQILKLRRDSFVGKAWIPVKGEFRKLKFLLLEMLDLESWQANETHFPRLECLKIRLCMHLEKIGNGIRGISTLGVIEVYGGSFRVQEWALLIKEELLEMGYEDLLVIFKN